ncbi:cryptochrome/photolyase family protein [bacterium CPR1]|nr:cryptochrome/photolyase family protein [bacterium CPR1]
MQTAWILGDQLSLRNSALAALDKAHDQVLLIESLERARQLPYHKQKMVLLWSGMRHFADELRSQGYRVDYHAACADYAGAVAHHRERFRPRRILMMEPADYGVAEELGADEITPDSLFVCPPGQKPCARLEHFYRAMRRATGILMDGDEPHSGRWNYDADNREVPEKGHRFPPLPSYPPDAITREVMSLVERELPGHFGHLEEFSWPVTRSQAEHFLEDFLEHRLDLFGPYEDAMVTGERALYHSLLSPLLNLGLLDPLEVCQRAEQRYRSGQARLSSVEGFIRQILGWREFVRQVYRRRMPGYLEGNHLQADLPLPAFYWDGETDMACLREAVTSLMRHGINHHIQRLMVTGNFALIAGVEPRQVNDWYLLAYADAYEWVVSPNVLGLSLFADGGVIASKPYAASANYLNKMSDHCAGCHYNPRSDCPFNALYWDFLARHQGEFRSNPRMALMVKQLERKGDLEALRARAAELRSQLRAGGRF